MNTLSLCIICKNEEKNIGNLLDSIKGNLFDEIILVDTGSNDSTISIIKSFIEYPIKLYHFEWIDDFSAARNYSFAQARCTYQMWCDADDIIKPKDYQKLLELKPTLHEADMWLMKYEYNHDEYDNVTCSFYRERIIKRSLNLQWQDPIHEYLPLTANMKTTDIEIHHYKKHSTSKRNIELLEKLIQKSNEPRNFYYLAKEYMEYGIHDKGIEMMAKFFQMPGWVENKYMGFMKLAEYYSSTGKFKESKDNYFEAIKLIPYKAEPYCKLGEISIAEKDTLSAIHWYKIAANMERPKNVLDLIEPQYYTYVPHFQLNILYNSIGEIQKAAYHLEEAYYYNPKNSNIAYNRKIFIDFLKDKYPYKYTEKPEFSIGWLIPNDIEAGTIRIRTLNIMNYLKSNGYKSELCDFNSYSQYDYIIVGKIFDEISLEEIKNLKKKNKKIACDLSEDILEYDIVQKILNLSDIVICCSEELRKKVSRYNSNAIVIEDAVEYIL